MQDIGPLRDSIFVDIRLNGWVDNKPWTSGLPVGLLRAHRSSGELEGEWVDINEQR